MEPVVLAFEHYMSKSLGINLELKPCKSTKKIPFFIRELYDIYELSLLKKPCLMVVLKEDGSITPAAIKKHLSHLTEILKLPCIYLAKVISSYDRQRLAKHGVQFVIPGRYIYLPGLGIDWAERGSLFQQNNTISQKQLSPSSQTVIIYALVYNKNEFTVSELAKKLNYTPMTITRVFNELESFGIGKTKRKGKERWLQLPKNPSTLWKQSLPFLKNPIKKRVLLKIANKEIEKIKNKGILSGYSALAKISMLVEPKHPVYAINPHLWKKLKKSQYLQILPNDEEADIEIEVWSYDPFLFSKEGRVDCFSLYLSLKENADERTEIVLKNMLKEFEE